MNEQIALAIISATGGIITTWLVRHYRDKGTSPKKNYINDTFDGFERLIKEQQKEKVEQKLEYERKMADKNRELDRKDVIIKQQQALIESMGKIKE